LQSISVLVPLSQRPSSIFLPLASECLTGAWGDYPAAIAMMSVFGIVFVEIAAFR
ncbi:hypothetical protein FRC03_006302, partial [Tulasnella sp. 419]